MIALNVVVAYPVVLSIHIVTLTTIQPDLRPVVALFGRADLVVAHESGCFSKLALSAVRVASGHETVVFFIMQVKCTTIGRHS